MIMTFTALPVWRQHRDQLTKRVAEIIGFTADCPPYQYPKESDRWVLNSSNDWWLTFQADGTCDLRYRYQCKPEQWAALKAVVEMFLCGCGP